VRLGALSKRRGIDERLSVQRMAKCVLAGDGSVRPLRGPRTPQEESGARQTLAPIFGFDDVAVGACAAAAAENSMPARLAAPSTLRSSSARRSRWRSIKSLSVSGTVASSSRSAFVADRTSFSSTITPRAQR
jgi:hypothetical protein